MLPLRGYEVEIEAARGGPCGPMQIVTRLGHPFERDLVALRQRLADAWPARRDWYRCVRCLSVDRYTRESEAKACQQPDGDHHVYFSVAVTVRPSP